MTPQVAHSETGVSISLPHKINQIYYAWYPSLLKNVILHFLQDCKDLKFYEHRKINTVILEAFNTITQVVIIQRFSEYFKCIALKNCCRWISFKWYKRHMQSSLKSMKEWQCKPLWEGNWDKRKQTNDKQRNHSIAAPFLNTSWNILIILAEIHELLDKLLLFNTRIGLHYLPSRKQI